MTLLWLSLACEQGPWTDEAALRPTLARLDRDDDGAVRAAEYGTGEGIPFAEADADADGTLGLDELRTVLDAQDPAGLEGTQGPILVPTRARGGTKRGRRPDHYDLAWQTLHTLRAEVLDADRDAAVPTAEEIEAAAAGGLQHGEGKALLERFRAEYLRLGMSFPRGI